MRNTILIMPETSHRDSEVHGIVRTYWFIWALYTQPSFLAPQGIFVGSNPKCPQNTNPHVTKNMEIQPSFSAFLNGPWLRHLVGWWIGLRYFGTSMGTNSTRLWGGWLDGFRRKLEVGPHLCFPRCLERWFFFVSRGKGSFPLQDFQWFYLLILDDFFCWLSEFFLVKDDPVAGETNPVMEKPMFHWIMSIWWRDMRSIQYTVYMWNKIQNEYVILLSQQAFLKVVQCLFSRNASIFYILIMYICNIDVFEI